MEVDLGLVQNNQYNYQHVELTKNTNMVNIVGVDPNVALQLQQQSAIAEIHGKPNRCSDRRGCSRAWQHRRSPAGFSEGP